MRAIRAASAALLSAAAVVLTVAPVALAGEDDNNTTSFGFSVSPATVAPGGTVTLKSDGCEVPSVTVTSGVFDTVTLNEGRSGNATVDVDAKTGAQYEITFDCKGERGTTTLSIAQGTTGGNTTGHDESPPPAAHKGVKAGYGTAATSGADTDGLGVAEVVTGVLLIVGALGAAVVLTRRRATDGRA
ncbi:MULTISPECIES: hypothetical protein [unclassified Streptomyces]|uniref:hypothetical protein n=1 Tax=unclassified Streptomyces TaxID=2593676 RepID=UPI001E635250|nr:hypothetical protein [Streptomyces sp. CB02980]MCB8906028.1 hypothetical protein [Streptomyces sp. CB02980]